MEIFLSESSTITDEELAAIAAYILINNIPLNITQLSNTEAVNENISK